jgi:non-heme chloroperoxidase
MENKVCRFIVMPDGAKIYIEDEGFGPIILFIHGWPFNQQIFNLQITALTQKNYRCISLDLRGFGKSADAPGNYTYDQFADDLKNIIRDLNLTQIILCGYSMGAAIAIRYMTRHNSHGIKKLILLAAASPIFTSRPDFPYGIPEKRLASLIKLYLADRPALLNKFIKNFFHQPQSDLAQSFTPWLQNMAMSAAVSAAVRAAQELASNDQRAELAEILTPTLILHGLSDKICSHDLAIYLQTKIKDSYLISLANTSHGILWDEAETVSDAILNFAKN